MFGILNESLTIYILRRNKMVMKKKPMKKKGMARGGAMKKKGMANGGKTGMTLASIRAAAKAKGYKLMKG